MTNKQDDIPDDVWKVAQDVAKSLWLTTAKTTHIARAILAERERCALYIEQRSGSIPDRQEIAAAIRKGAS